MTTRKASHSLPERAFLSMDEAAYSMGICRNTLELAWRSGQIRTVKIGARRLVPVSELARLEASAAAVDLAAVPAAGGEA